MPCRTVRLFTVPLFTVPTPPLPLTPFNIIVLISDVGIVDSTETLSLHREFSIPGSVRVTDGRCGIPKVNLTHPGGSFCDVYLRGGNILSWVLANGGEVFYTPDGTDLASDALSDWGTSLCFPQYGGEHQLAGTPPGKKLLPTDGLTKTANWTIAQTGLYEDTEGEYPYVIIETADSEATRAVWNNGFHIVMEIALHHSALDISLTVKNTGDRRLKYSFALKNHIAVADIEDPSANYVGFNDCLYIDSKLHESKSRVRFSKQLNKQGPLHLKKAIDRVYFQTQNDTGVDTGTGCTVYVRNLCSAEEDGFLDRAIFNPWKEQDPVNYRWYAGLAIGAIGEPIKVDAGMTRTHQTRIEVHDVSSIVPVTERMNAYNNYSVLNMASHKSNSPDDNLPHDFQ